MADDDDTTTADKAKSVGETIKIVISVLILVALVAFGVANSDSVPVEFLVSDAEIPLIAVILGSAVAGALIAALLRRRRS